MSKRKGYTPELKRELVSVLHHEAKARHIPMTALANRLISAALRYEGIADAATASRVSETAPKVRRSAKSES
jgi:hypothetical protein